MKRFRPPSRRETTTDNMSKLFLPVVLVAFVFCAGASAKCKGPIKCSQGKQTLDGEPNFVLYKDTNGLPFWSDLEESVSNECITVVYNDCSVQAFGKGDPNAVFAKPGTCTLKDGRAYCACNDAHYCNIDLNRWFKAANELFGAHGAPMQCRKDLVVDPRYKTPEQC